MRSCKDRFISGLICTFAKGTHHSRRERDWCISFFDIGTAYVSARSVKDAVNYAIAIVPAEKIEWLKSYRCEHRTVKVLLSELKPDDPCEIDKFFSYEDFPDDDDVGVFFTLTWEDTGKQPMVATAYNHEG